MKKNNCVMPKERKLGEVFKTPWGKLKVVENKNRNGDLCVFGPCYYCCYDPGDKEFKKVDKELKMLLKIFKEVNNG